MFGLYQDHYMTVKYTDIDYLVFSDAANYVANGQSPYLRETYRYTPLLAWFLVPNQWWPHFGKIVFMVSDLVTGYLIVQLLKFRVKGKQLLILSSIWLLNPMVITISTRGSAESVLTVMIMLSVYYARKKSFNLSAIWLGIAIHFKIYPIIYLPTMMLYLIRFDKSLVNFPLLNLANRLNIQYLLVTISTFVVLNLIMYQIYGYEFLYHTYLYHVTRLDHRHNFSVYNILLYYKSSITNATGIVQNIEKFAFIPQLLISGILIPLKFGTRDFVSCLFLQTFAFVTFNKVITSQYFIWFLFLLPHYLSTSQLIKGQYVQGIVVLLMWVATQGIWLYFAYKLEFLGISTFDNGLLMASCGFFLSNCWILGVFINDLNVSAP